MENSGKDYSSIDKLLNDIIENDNQSTSIDLKDLFERRLVELDIPLSTAAKILGVENRALNGILNGTQKQVDFTILIKIANFLQISNSDVVLKFLMQLKKKFPSELSFPPQKIEFIKSNFDLSVFKKAGFIDSISDYSEIERKINNYFGYKSIFEYSKLKTEVAYSSGIIKPKNELSRLFWIESAKGIFNEISNPYRYDKQKLIEFFPEIRRYSTNVDYGLTDVIKKLFVLGITVIYQESLPSIHLRGATFSVNDKPCIVITNYKGFYPTLWFALVHELFHVLFDWEEISTDTFRCHLSDSENTQVSVIEKEKEADDFARAYLLSIEKTEVVKKYVHSHELVTEFANNNHVHSSFVYVFLANDLGGQKGIHWARAHRYNPKIDKFIKTFENPWNQSRPISDVAKKLKFNVFN